MLATIAGAYKLLHNGAETGEKEACRALILAISEYGKTKLSKVIKNPIEYNCPIRFTTIDPGNRASKANEKIAVDVGMIANDCWYQFLEGSIPEMKSDFWGSWGGTKGYICVHFTIDKSSKFNGLPVEQAKLIWASKNTWGGPLEEEQVSILDYIEENGFLKFEEFDTFQEGISYSVVYADFPETVSLFQKALGVGIAATGNIEPFLASVYGGDPNDIWPDGILIIPTRLVDNNDLNWIKMAPENMIVTREVT